jgi:hypothetical protein
LVLNLSIGIRFLFLALNSLNFHSLKDQGLGIPNSIRQE